ncbi:MULTISPECIES: TPM domain-containing protein [unclassified Bradyrhizobium]|uniref:TPM domain-containing protein n=1 Tax=unclassified Bradyrhizobium TaxID=2631580 RepID=UPI002FEF1E39
MDAARAPILALLVCWACSALALVAVPPLSGRVVDQTGTLGSIDIVSLTRQLKDLETRKGSEIAVLIVPTTDGEAIEQFSLRVAEAWKIGRKKIDDGALLVIAKNDRRLRIEVGYGLEGALTDVTTKRIIDEDITPKFKAGDFAGGVSAGITRIIRVADGEKLPEPEPPHWQSPGLFNTIDPFNPFVLAFVFIVGGVLRASLGRLVGSAATGGFVGVLTWLLVGSLGAAAAIGVLVFLISAFIDLIPSGGSRGTRGGWSSGGSSDWSSSGSSGSSSGGFSGSGGNFGGGGASGNW